MNRITALAATAVLVFAAAQLPTAGSAAAPGVSPLEANEIQFSYDKLRADF